MNTVVETINAAGRAFVDFSLPMLIQSGVLILILLAMDAILRRKVRAVFRYWIWMLVLVKLVLPPSLGSPVSLGTWFGDTLQVPAASFLEPEPPQAIEPQATELPPAISTILSPPDPAIVPPLAPRMSPAPADAREPAVPEAKPAVRAPAASLNWQGLTLLVWSLVAIALSLLLVQRAFFVRGLVGQAEEANRAMLSELEGCRARLGLRRPVGLRLSPNATSPAVCGLLRPVILIPQSLAPRLHGHDLHAVLLHELAHVKRGDLWINFVQTLLQIAYFYNPLLWLANAMIRRTREQAVDETVLVAMGETAPQYPETLVHIAKLAFARRPILSLRLIGVVESKSALTGRIRHILNRPLPKTARLGLIGAIAVLIAAAVLLPMARAAEESASVDNRGPRDIRLVGVRPDAGDELYDADGRKLDVPMNFLGGDSGPWKDEEQRRDFILRAPELDGQLLFLPVWVRAAGANQIVGGGSISFRGVEDPSTLILPTTFDREYRKSGTPLVVPVARVDLPLQYFHGERREALCTFTGPFVPGKTVQADAGRSFQLTPEAVEYGDGTLLNFRFSTEQEFEGNLWVLGYDKQGRRYLLDSGTGAHKYNGIDRTYHANAVPWDQIAVVTVGEKPHEITFRNVAVRYPRRPARTHAAYLDVMAQRLGLTGRTPEQLRQYTVKSPREALAVLDVVRGDWHIRTTFEVLERARPPINMSDLDPATQQKIRRVAARWADSASVSHYGIQLGLIGQWPEFFDLAMDRLGRDYPAAHLPHFYEEMWLKANGEIASTLSTRWTELNAPQVERIKRLILDARGDRVSNRFFWCLRRIKSPEVVDALWELAQDERPWIWWNALDAWYGHTVRTRSGYGDLPEEIRVRLSLVKGIPVDEGLKAKASALLARILTPEVAGMDSVVWGQASRKAMEEFDKETTTRIYIENLRQVQSAITPRQWLVDYPRSHDLTLMAAHMIRTLNVWYGVDIGRLGTDETARSSLEGPKTYSGFQALVAEALEWRRVNQGAKPLDPAFQGKVVDSAGRPIPMAEVSLIAHERIEDGGGYRIRDDDKALRYRTDAAGSFVFTNLQNTHHTLRVAAEGFGTRENLSVMQRPDGRFKISGEEDNVIVLEKPASLSGRIVGPDSRPPANARVHVLSYPTHAISGRSRAETDAQGRFTIGPIMSGYHLVRYFDHTVPAGVAHGEISRAFRLVRVEEGASVEDVVLDLRESTCSLEFEIVDLNDKPLPSDLVVLEIPLSSGDRRSAAISAMSITRPEKSYRLDHLPPMDGSLRVNVQGDAPRIVNVQLRPNETARARIKFEGIAGEPDPNEGWTPRGEVVLPEADRRPVILDLATGELVPLPPAGPEPRKVQQALRQMGKGDLLYDVDLGDRTFILLRDATSEQVQEDTGEPGVKGHLINPQRLPETLTITTAEGRRYEVTILSADENGCTLKYSPLPFDKGAGGGALAESGKAEAGIQAKPSNPDLAARLANGVTVELLAYSQLDQMGLRWRTPKGEPATIPGVHEADAEGYGSLVALRIEPAPEAGVFAWSFQPPDVRRELKPVWRVNGSDIWLVPLGEGRSYVNLELMAKVRDPAVAQAIARAGFSLPDAFEVAPWNMARITDVNRVDSDSTAFTVVVGQDGPSGPQDESRVVAALDVAGQVHSLRRAQRSEYAAIYAGFTGWARYETDVPVDRFAGIVAEGYSEREASMKLRNLSLRPGQPTQVRIEVAPQQQGPWWHRSEYDSQLESLGRALLDYAEENEGRYPPDLSAVRVYFEDTQWRWFQEHAVYLGAGKSSTQTDGVPLAYEKTLLPFGFGTYVLYSDDRVKFEVPQKLAELGIAAGSSKLPAESRSNGIGSAAGWQDIGEAIPPDANDMRTLAPGVTLDGIGQDVEGKLFVSILREIGATGDRQYRFRVYRKDGQVLESQYYLSLERDGGKLWEKFTFDAWYHEREIDHLSLQSRHDGDAPDGPGI